MWIAGEKKIARNTNDKIVTGEKVEENKNEKCLQKEEISAN
jgi:hypothetical protein